MPTLKPHVFSIELPDTPAVGRTYHHGDLRAALLDAAEAELREHGPVGFSLRATARRARVSHGAPAHHFSNAEALLAALAEVGFDRMASRIAAAVASAVPLPVDRLAAAGRAYIDFARGDPHMFRMMFQVGRSAEANPFGGRTTASQRAFGQLQQCVAEVQGPHATEGESATALLTAWGVVHGIAHLAIDSASRFLGPLDTAVDTAIVGMARSLVK